jgi:protein involved in polysaccharide export with SLBB domain
MKKLIFPWRLFAALLLLSGARAFAADPPLASANTNLTLSVAPQNARAAWQQHFTLGPGDVISLALYKDEALELIRENVVITPDGKVSYLQAQDILAAGLTIDELRTNVDLALTNYYARPHSVIMPVAIHSKKYYVLGAVVNKGVFTFDRPLTLIEAIARAGGLETGVFERNTVELADLSHSFLVRRGQRVPVDFEKLFQQGDLSQNIPLEPDDYVYFASASANEIYVLGEVTSPGIVPYSPKSGVIGAITTRGGFTPKSFKGRVLIVRGSLKSQETFVVDTAEILDAKKTDFRLKPKDIVYVAARPWHKAEELLDEGTRAFIEAVIVSYTGAHIGPFISQPLIH